VRTTGFFSLPEEGCLCAKAPGAKHLAISQI